MNIFFFGSTGSAHWLGWTNVFCAAGTVLALCSIFRHLAQHKRVKAGGEAGKNLASLGSLGVLVLALIAISISVWNRYIEVNHFPSQTMSEVLVMFSLALLASMVVLHYALKLERLGYGWAIADDALLLLTFLGVVGTNYYASTLTTGQRDLPPALQSYWFPPHLAALIFSYATLYLSGAIVLIYFGMRFWSGVFVGGKTRASQLLVLVAMLILPFGQMITIPILLVVGLVFLGMKFSNALPERAAMAGLEKQMDEVSYRAFCVGIPFLTAGLFMGAFWAQEAWANYWGWDSKENSALITWLVYVIYIHLRMLGGFRGEKAMAVLGAGALSVFMTFQLFGYLPDSQKSLHRYTDDGVVPREGTEGVAPDRETSARLERSDPVDAPELAADPKR